MKRRLKFMLDEKSDYVETWLWLTPKHVEGDLMMWISWVLWMIGLV